LLTDQAGTLAASGGETEEVNMKSAVGVALGAVCLASFAACTAHRTAHVPSVTTITSSQILPTAPPPTLAPKEIRARLVEHLPNFADQINKLVISTEGGVVTLQGPVESDGLRLALLNQVRAMPNVSGFRDGLEVRPGMRKQR
jgi:hypothetical protein